MTSRQAGAHAGIQATRQASKQAGGQLQTAGYKNKTKKKKHTHTKGSRRSGEKLDPADDDGTLDMGARR